MSSNDMRESTLDELTNKIKIKPHIFKNLHTPVYSFLRLIFGQLLRSITRTNF